MAGGTRLSPCTGALSLSALAAALLWATTSASAQEPIATPPPASTAAPVEPNVLDIRVEGNSAVSLSKVLGQISSRAGRPFDQTVLEKDVRKLVPNLFLDARPKVDRTPQGVIITFQVVERPTLTEVKYLGNVQIKTKSLANQTELKKGDALDVYAIEEGKRKIEQYYHEKGFNHVRVTIVEGTKPRDRRAIYLISEGQAQKIWWVNFEGNTIASDARLRTQIQSKPPLAWIFKGYVEKKKIDEDVDRIVSYYRSLGYFRAVASRALKPDESQKWATLTFYIIEGPRYSVRNVSFNGNRKFSTEQLSKDLELTSGQFFDQNKSQADQNLIKDLYGSQGYIFADVQADVRFYEDKEQVDLVYNVSQGDQYYVSRINIHIEGENPHTRHNTVRTRLSLHPGDIVDIRQVRASERRLKAAGLFLNDPQRNIAPRIVFTPPGGEDPDSEIARGGGQRGSDDTFRGQSPDDTAVRQRDRVWIDLERVKPAQRSGHGIPYPQAMKPMSHQQAPYGRDLVRGQSGSAAQAIQRSAPVRPFSAPLGGPASPGINPGYRSPALPPAHSGLPYPNARLRPQAPDEQLLIRGQSTTGPRWGGSSATGQGSFGGQGLRAVSPEAASPASYVAQNQTGRPAPPALTTQQAQQAVYRQDEQRVVRGQYTPYQAEQTQWTTDENGARSLAPQGPYGQSWSTYQNPPAGSMPNYVPSAPGYTQSRPEVVPANPYGAPPGAQQYGTPQGAFTAPQAGQQSPYYMAPPPQAYSVPQTPGVPPGEVPPVIGYGPDGTLTPGGSIYSSEPPPRPIPLDIYVEETQTGRVMFGVGVNSEAGVVGSVIVDEQNFDIGRPATSWDDFRTGRAWRGAGQRFRLEAAPGTQLQRYIVDFTEPYLFDTPISLGLSGFFYTRNFRDWDEERVGGRASLGYQFTPDLSGNVSLGAQQVEITDPKIPSPPELLEVLGNNALYTARTAVRHDTRDNTFLATEGHYIELAYEQGLGDFTFPRGTIDARQYFMMRQRPDGSGRHVLSLIGRLGVAGNDTPLFEHFFAGGFSTLRGFSFRGASPVNMGVIVGGEFQMLGSVEYLFPITADDMLRGVTFVDFGTVEPDVQIENFRVAPGIGLRITIPALGPAPIALDFAVPVAKAPDDDTQIFSFYVGFGRN